MIVIKQKEKSIHINSKKLRRKKYTMKTSRECKKIIEDIYDGKIFLACKLEEYYYKMSILSKLI